MKNPHPRTKLTSLLAVGLALACFALSPQARAVCQEGCLTNQNTVLGDDALLNNTTGYANTATGLRRSPATPPATATRPRPYRALFLNTTGNDNTATGYDALLNNTTGSDNTAIGELCALTNTTGIHNTATGA